MKRVAITPSYNEDGSRLLLSRDYPDSLLRAGVFPVVLPPLGEPEEWAPALEGVDGLLLSGGADVDPSLYGEKKRPCCGRIEPERDKMELGLCRIALERDMPILAICRGHQVLNVTLGGTLWQDIKTQYSAELEHPVYDRPREQVHGVDLDNGSRIAEIIGSTTISVNSRHHQAIREPGKGLVVTGHSADGVIEAVEMPGKRFVVGVQWHPESLSSYDPASARLFSAFAKAL